MVQHIFALVTIGLLSTTFTEGSNTTTVGSCEGSHWVYKDGYCYWSSSFNFGKSRMNSWFGAERICRQIGADLVSIHSESENNFVHKMTHCAGTWTGLTLVDNAKRGKPEGMEWIDGTRRTYLNWYGSEPAGDSYNRHNCYYMHPSTGGKWSHAMCTYHRKYYVCKKKALNVPSISNNLRTRRAASVCGKGWKLEGKKCLFVNNTRVDFFEALLQCQSMGSHLAILHSSLEEASLSRAFDSCDTPWIGLENTDPKQVNTNAGWKWNDNTHVRYSNWQSTVPANDQSKQCGKLVTGLSWVNTHCWELQPFICEKTADI